MNALPEESQKAQEGLKALKQQYGKLIANQRARMRDDPGYRLETMKKRLEDMFKLLNCWQQYIDIIYAPEADMNFRKVLKDSGMYTMDPSDAESRQAGAPDEMSFAMKMQNEDVERRLQTLLARGDEEELEKEKKNVAREVDEQYLSVNEAMTTDTPLTSEVEDKDMKRSSVESEADAASNKAQKMLKQQAGIASSSEDEVEEAQSEVGIQSSDEEREGTASPE